MPSYDPHKHHRKSIRLKGYDYSQPGEYFITICTKDKECVFGEIVNGKMILNEMGKIAETIWKEIPKHFLHTELDEFVVMPNHIHGIINIVYDVVGATDSVALKNDDIVRVTDSVTPTKPNGPMPYSIGTIIGQYKSVVTKQINHTQQTFGKSVWQKNYYEHIIRDKKELQNIRQYIFNNPLQWKTDEENPYKLS